MIETINKLQAVWDIILLEKLGPEYSFPPKVWQIATLAILCIMTTIFMWYRIKKRTK